VFGSSALVSWWLTMLLHRFPAETTPFETQMRLNQFDYLQSSEHAQAVIGGAVCRLAF
jgi:hypothetical protein